MHVRVCIFNFLYIYVLRYCSFVHLRLNQAGLVIKFFKKKKKTQKQTLSFPTAEVKLQQPLLVQKSS